MLSKHEPFPAAERLERFRSRPDVAPLIDQAAAAQPTLPVIDVGFAFGSFCSGGRRTG
jgi:hypothetical protein